METASKDVEHMCRTCMCTNQCGYSIFDCKEDKNSMLEMFAITIPQLVIQANDELPAQICDECHNKLNIAYNFHLMCISSDKQLRAITLSGRNDNDAKTIKSVDEELPIYMEMSQSLPAAETENDPLIENNLLHSQKHIKIEKQEDTTIVRKRHKISVEDDADEGIITMANDLNQSDVKDELPDIEPSTLVSDSNCNNTAAAMNKNSHDNTQLSCEFCSKVFKHSKRYAKHIKKHQIEKEQREKQIKAFTCKSCDKGFQTKFLLKQHMRIHSEEKPYLCPHCGKSFKTYSTLHQHAIRHSEQKRYQCDECPSKFPCKADLSKHMSMHRTFKPHVCDTCGSRFTRSYTLNKHKQIHTGERPFKCDECQMTFVFIYHMRRHMRTHTGEKPYKCKFCDRAYSESGDLNKHMRLHVGENTYICTQCPQAFKYQLDLRRHQGQHYKEEQQLQHQQQQQQSTNSPTTKQNPSTSSTFIEKCTESVEIKL